MFPSLGAHCLAQVAALEEGSSVKQREIKCLQTDVDTIKQSLNKLVVSLRLLLPGSCLNRLYI